MKILHTNDVVYSYAMGGDTTGYGGAERYQWLLARAMASAGWSVTVGVRTPLALNERQAVQGVNFVGIGQGNILQGWYRLLKAERPDWWFWQCADHWLGPAFELAKLVKVGTMFSVMIDRDVHPSRALFRRPWLWPLYAWGLNRSDRIFVQHGKQLAGLAPRWKAKASILPGIVDQKSALRSGSSNSDYVVWVAALRLPKRPDLLIEIASRLSDVHFIVCGGLSTFMTPPGYGEKIISKLRTLRNVDYLGHVHPEQTLKIIGDAAILLSTSDEEGYPSVFLEAWASGTPVVSLTIDPDDVIKKKGLGLVSGNVDGAVRDIQSLMGSSHRREELAARVRRHVESSHSESAAVAAIKCAIEKAEV